MVNVFVYGTLMPGHRRWPLLEQFATRASAPALVPGRLYRTTYGWPAAVFDGNVETEVPGMLVPIDPAIAARALDQLDAVEGVPSGLFERIEVTTSSGKRCFTYHWPGSTVGFEEIDAWHDGRRPGVANRSREQPRSAPDVCPGGRCE